MNSQKALKDPWPCEKGEESSGAELSQQQKEGSWVLQPEGASAPVLPSKCVFPFLPAPSPLPFSSVRQSRELKEGPETQKET